MRHRGESVNAKDCKGWILPTKEAKNINANQDVYEDYALAA